MSFLDRNANTQLRDRRNAQRLRAGDATSSIKLADSSLTNSASGLGVKLASINPALLISGGLQVTTADVTLSKAAGGLFVQLAAGGGLSTTIGGIFVAGLEVVASDPTSPIDGNAWYNSATKSAKDRQGGLTLGGSRLAYANVVDGATVINTTTATASLTSVTFPANFFTAGKVVRIKYHGHYSCAAGANLSVGAFAVNGGTVVSLDGNPAFAAFVGAAGANFGGESFIICRTTGAAGTMSLMGDFLFDTNVHNFSPAFNSVTIDTTLAYTIQLRLTWSVANAGNSALINDMIIEVLGPN